METYIPDNTHKISGFGKIRNVIWPIYSNELKKFIPLSGLIFLILMSQNIIRNIKDTLVVTELEPEVINFIKLFIEAPIGLFIIIIYTKMCNRFRTESVFRFFLLVFITFFTIFTFILYPNSEYIHPNREFINALILNFPNLKWFFVMSGKWIFVLFYVVGELWPILMFNILYWQLANKITNIEEAGRFYPFLLLIGQTNLLFSSSIIIYFTSNQHFLFQLFSHLSDRVEISLRSLNLIVILSGICCLGLHVFIDQNFVNHRINRTKEDKLQISFRESIKLIIRSKYLLLICISTICYSTAINLIEGLCMHKVKEFYQNKSDIMIYNANVQLFTGISTIFFAIIGSSIIRNIGWKAAALMTPIIILFMGSLFYFGVLIENFINYESRSILFAIIMIGALYNIMIKGVKYSIFDSTKEMAYIPLHNEMKTKGKAAVDMLGAKIGKSCGSVIQVFIFILYPFSNYQNIAGVLIFFFIITCVVWIISCTKLSRHYTNLITTTSGKTLSK